MRFPQLRVQSAFLLAVLLVFSIPCQTQDSLRFPFQNPDLPLRQRISDLISRMTLDEKARQTLYDAPAIERLGVPAYNWWNEALHGVARAGRATVFPQAIGLAATWDADLMLRVAGAISDEARAKHHEFVRRGSRGIYEGLTFWSPNINIFRDPRWGRGMETFGEDPYLTGRLAVQFVRGMQGNDPRYLKTVATPKHFAVHSGPEPERHAFDANVDERDLRETYLPAFRAAIMEGNARSVMCAYNRFRGDPCCGSSTLLQHILRDEWKFDGYVVSDCWAIMDFFQHHKVVRTKTEAAAMALSAGTDLNCGVAFDSLAVAVRQGLLRETLIDTALTRLFEARFRLGMFDPPERVPYASIPYGVNDSPGHQALAVEATGKSIVLLKNDGNMLPLRKDLGTIAVIGPNADDVEVLLGNYNGTPSAPITPLTGIREAVSSRTHVLYAPGCNIAGGLPAPVQVPSFALLADVQGARRQGLRGEYFDNQELSGEPLHVRVDSTLDFNWWDASPAAGMRSDSFSVRWSGTLVPPMTGDYALGMRVLGHAKLYFDDSLLVEIRNRHSPSEQWKHLALTAGTHYKIRVEYRDVRPDAIVQLLWSIPGSAAARRAEALDAAHNADAVVMFLGLSPRLEGEEMEVKVPGFAGGDRVEIGLPGIQEELVEAVQELGKPVVVVLLNGSALAIPRLAATVPAIVEAWYPGQAAGTAIAGVLFGDVNPAGRLPVTFYESLGQLPPFADYTMKGRTYRYFAGQPLFPFGHGLSYTTFRYGSLRMPARVKAGDSLRVTVDVLNAGKRSGDEVVQLYVTDIEASFPVPLRSLQGFRRVTLAPGEKRRISFTLQPRQLSLLDGGYRRIIEPGAFEISVGGKQPGFRGMADAKTTGVVSGRVTVEGTVELEK